MLKKLVKLLNVGLLRNGAPTPVQFDLVTLIYAENGRGKTTVANVLRAIGIFDSASMEDGRTIDSDGAPSLELLFEHEGTNNPIALNNGTWTGAPHGTFVFDPTFVEDNVYSGQEVRPDQRQSLLQFALGTESVELEREIAELTRKISDATKKVTESGKRISAFAKQMPIQQFVDLVDVPDAETQIEALRGRMEASKNAATLAQRLPPDRLTQLDLDIDAFFGILQATFSGIQEDARAAVQKHFEQHTHPAGIEEWVTKGREFSTENGCPFCGQDIGAAALIGAYDAYFNKAYDDFMARVSVLSRGVDQRLAAAKMDSIEAVLNTNQARIDAWKDQLEIVTPNFDLGLAKETADALRSLASDLALQKQRRPLDMLGTDSEKATAFMLLAQIRRQIEDYNSAVDVVIQRIREFNRTLAAETPTTLMASIVRLETVVVRRDAGAIAAVFDYKNSEQAKEELNAKKKDARAKLDALLPKVLSDYQGRINTFLKRFGAGFEIVRFNSGYQGGQLRSEYALQLRGRSVELGKRTDAGPSFRSMLSEADKRTLALAFFLARLHGHSGGLKGQVVVFDDPVSSLDANRRDKTIKSLIEVVEAGAQVIVLSHDPYFLNDLRERLQGPPHGLTPKVHEIKRVAEDYSAFAACELETICESDYARRHRNLRAFIDGTYTGSTRDLADDLRPVVEGFLKRRFPPPLLPQNANLGSIIKLVQDAPDNSPLAWAKPSVQKMSALNEYSIGFHHDDAKPVPQINTVELIQHAKMALELIYGDHVLH